MIDQRTEQPSCRNGCGHEMWTIEEIGNWIHDHPPGRRTVQEVAAGPDLWDEGRAKLSHEELRQQVESAGCISCRYALDATTVLDGVVHLGNGVHRWAVARELSFETVPVRMGYELEEPAWPRW